jgi:hypothetical protein
MLIHPITEVISIPQILQNCHSERSEESRFFKYLRPLAAPWMTEKSGFEIAYRQLNQIIPG